MANWALLGERVSALSGPSGELPPPRSRREAQKPSQPYAHVPPAPPDRLQGDAEATGEYERLLRDVCKMLRVGRGVDLIPVLAHVVRVATAVPQLEKLRAQLASRGHKLRVQLVPPPQQSEGVDGCDSVDPRGAPSDLSRVDAENVDLQDASAGK